MKRAVCVGINNYPGIFNDLKGCVNDAKDWSDLLQNFGFETSLMLDSQATKTNIKAALQNLVQTTNAGDIAVLTYSGHGTQVADTSSDEAIHMMKQSVPTMAISSTMSCASSSRPCTRRLP